VAKQQPSAAEIEAGRAAVDAYIAAQPPVVRARLATLRALIHEAHPGITERIAYQMPTFCLHGNLVHIAAFAHHIGLYPLPQGVEEFTRRLDALKLPYSKGAIQLPLDRDLPLDLVRDIVAFRVAQQAA
jgi:uncharacterized protein YdhG (YjbR/CyaY superfamily)